MESIISLESLSVSELNQRFSELRDEILDLKTQTHNPESVSLLQTRAKEIQAVAAELERRSASEESSDDDEVELLEDEEELEDLDEEYELEDVEDVEDVDEFEDSEELADDSEKELEGAEEYEDVDEELEDVETDDEEYSEDDGEFFEDDDIEDHEDSEFDHYDADSYEPSTDSQNFSKTSVETQIKVVAKTVDDVQKELETSAASGSRTIYDHRGVALNPLQSGTRDMGDIPISEINVSPRSRKNLDPRKMERLELSISEWGQLEPILIAPLESGGYVLLHGYRRLMAKRRLGHDTIWAIVDTTRNVALLRYIEIIANSSQIPYGFLEIMTAGQFISSKQEHFTPDIIEDMLGLERGEYLEAQFILSNRDYAEEILLKVLDGKMTILQAAESIRRKQKKDEKQREKELQESGAADLSDLVGDQNEYTRVDNQPRVQSTKDRQTLPPWLIKAIEKRDNLTCQCCGLGHEDPHLACVFEKHHLRPVYKGGADEESNLILLCRNCHAMVTAMDEGRFMPPIGREDEFHNIILLANIIKIGGGGVTPYERYVNERVAFWLED